MNQAEKTNLTNLGKNQKFNNVMEKLTKNIQLTEEEKTYVLTIALIFLRYYDNDKKFTTYIEFAYYIILKYSIQYQDYKPLYDFSTEFGFFPITKNILLNKLLDNLSIKDILIDSEIDFYNYKDQYIQTIEQFDIHKNLLEENFQDIAFIAPTSYGKSSIIIDFIKKYNMDDIKIGVIVPSKSLLIQTFNLLKKENLEKRLLLHDEMYDNDKSFIAIFTQERALRLLKKKDVYFDILFIDEAHNLFKKDSRSILLSRLIKRNLQSKSDSKIIYLSPLIQEINNLKVGNTQVINEQRIHFNIKEPEIFEYLTNGNIRQYNRFIGQFYEVGNSSNYLEYINNNSLTKNFLYLKRPKMVEQLANTLAYNLPEIKGIQSLINTLNENVHEEFYISKLLTKGVIYIHGKLPDIIKEYLEYKFKTITSLKYIVANTVILEGINLPIDNMFILNVHELSEKDLTNLIGRINRLDTIFTYNTNNLYKLLPKVHFVNTDEYGRKNGKMQTSIEKLRSKIFKDKIQNPTLESFDFDELDKKIEKAKKEKDKELAVKMKERIMELVANENYLYQKSITEFDKLKKYFIENELNTFYKNFDSIIEKISLKIQNINLSEWQQKKLFDKIYIIFIEGIENDISKYEFKRLEFEPTRNYYSVYIERSHQNTLKENINHLFEYFKKRIKEKNSEFYFGESYGEIPKSTSSYTGYSKPVYVDLAKYKDDSNKLINLAIVKLQMEDNFISYKLNKFVEMMYDYKLITDEEYNLHIYGTEKPKNINLIKFGLSSSLISKLDADEQLGNLYIDDYGNLRCNNLFENFLENIDDFYKFQIEKYISKGFVNE
ncbi:DEAD/DEAH box helicase family protein [Aliarcobacter cryaerophilus]|uniref:DEAD/DEAH box helicase family protein n=1 Tax=Aliarcobacter cryaerophilus TaxID=28198 RepID=UPI0021B5F69D|nr:DEAD/DEAH box helicase family protein [Aliarcobacter cryaerophilus]MCT7542451.1 DEAD/DEAH box helicase family protein [Aliarcobacter cryaerophilus]